MKFCPTCGLPALSGRICAACLKPIARHHRFRFVGCFVIHVCCEDPELAAEGERGEGKLELGDERVQTK